MPTGLEYFQAADGDTLQIYREQWQTYEQHSLNLLKSLADRSTAEGVTTEFHQIAGGPGRKICEFAQDIKIKIDRHSQPDLLTIEHDPIESLGA